MRIHVVGTSGAGKSTLARELSETLNSPHIEIDNLRFLENWTVRDEDAFNQDLETAIKPRDWVACGNYFSSQANIYDHADVVIWVKTPFWKLMWRLLKRTLGHIWYKTPCCNGNIESVHLQFFSRKSIFWWAITTHPRRLKKYNTLSNHPDHRHKWIVIRNASEREKCIQTILNMAKSVTVE